jgi:uncharacterized repeat protein (TIGR02543 family)
MKAIFSLRRHGYLKTIGVFLIAVALIAGVVGCEGEPVPEFNLATAVNPAGYGTATDQTGTSPYEEGDIIDIEAVAADCYRFTGWTSSAGGTFSAANNATTTFTMPASDVTVTANFEEVPPDFYKFYEVDSATAPYVGEVVQLVDQFGPFEAMVGDAVLFGNPVEREHNGRVSPIADEDRHYAIYELLYEEAPKSWIVTIDNHPQDNLELSVQGPIALAVPTQKEDHEAPVCLDHLLVYEVLLAGEPAPITTIDLRDQFLDESGLTVYEPVLFANPVEKTAPGAPAPTPIEHADEHYVFYPIYGESFEMGIQIQNQFHADRVGLDLFSADLVAVPSQKISWEQPLSHFKTYWADWTEGPIPEGFPVSVQLEDQFITDWLGEPLTADVTTPHLFGNPVEKCVVDEFECTYIWNPNNHLTFYHVVFYEVMQTWEVTITNQFDPGVTQNLTVVGPVLLAVPTQKAEHDPPADLNHFLVYAVLDWTVLPGDLQVYLSDQFTERFAWIYEPELLAVPCQKTVAGGAPTPIIGDEHMVYYVITGGEFWIEALPIDNQFGPQDLYVYEGLEWDLLGVPSQKIEWTYVGPYTP